MILKMSPNKVLSLYADGEQIFVGENKASGFDIFITSVQEKINNLYHPEECSFTLRVFVDNGDCFSFPLNPTQTNGDRYYFDSIPVEIDLTDEERVLEAMIYITAPDGAVLKSNTVEIPVLPSPDGSEIIPRSELEAELNEHERLNELLETILNGGSINGN